MLDFSWSHILIVLIVAVVIVGPKDLPRVMRTVGRWASRARSVLSHVRSELMDVSRQADLDELRKEVAALKQTASPAAQPKAAAVVVPAPARDVRASALPQGGSRPAPMGGSGSQAGE